MGYSKRYTLSEFNALLRESNKNEFAPKLGDKVESEDKKNNEKAVSDILKQTKEFDGGFSDKRKNSNPDDTKDYNKTTLDVNFDSETSDSYKERVKAQVEGYPSVENKKNTDADDNESLDYEGNKKFYDDRKKQGDEVADRKLELKKSGLAARTMDDEIFKTKQIYTENMKRLHFKNTVFLSESQMLKKIPEDFRKADGRFLVKDANGTEYMVECKYDERFNFGELKVISGVNEQKVNEQLDRMRSLFNYSPSEYYNGSTSANRHQADTDLKESIDHMKELEEKGLND